MIFAWIGEKYCTVFSEANINTCCVFSEEKIMWCERRLNKYREPGCRLARGGFCALPFSNVLLNVDRNFELPLCSSIHIHNFNRMVIRNCGLRRLWEV
jgi:hypothetical protein